MITLARLALVLAALALAAPALAQPTPVIPSGNPELNPIAVLESAAEALPGVEGGLSAPLNVILLLTVLSLAPSVLILCTCFTRIVIVLGLLRQALGTQGLPPSQVMIGLSLFMTLAVMGPTLDRAWTEGIQPYASGESTDYELAWERTKRPFREFMFAQLDANDDWATLEMMLEHRGVDVERWDELTYGDVDMLALVPAYVVSELKTAFLIGFRIYLPFLVIDMVIASMLISMGMLMLPPVLISLPFKLLLFVLVDGWRLVVGSLMATVAQPDPGAYALAALGATGFV